MRRTKPVEAVPRVTEDEFRAASDVVRLALEHRISRLLKAEPLADVEDEYRRSVRAAVDVMYRWNVQDYEE